MYYGGKRRAAQAIWENFGDPTVYVEPFAGSLATLLWREEPCPREIVCDTDGYICNFWRAVTADPESVAHHADWPTIHQDLTARHAWLRAWGDKHREKLSEDAEWFDAKAAGWWVWGISIWIGGGWCSSSSNRMPNVQVGGGGQGVSAQRIRDQIPSVPNNGAGGVSAQRADIRLGPWFESISKRLSKVIVLNRDWTSAVTPTLLGDTPTSTKRIRAILLDPPYLTEKRTSQIYSSDSSGTSSQTASDAYAWAVEKGQESDYRIAYCCHDEDFPVPQGWSVHLSRFQGPNRQRTTRDAIFFSPACRTVQGRLF